MRTTPVALTAVILAAALSLTACGGGDDEDTGGGKTTAGATGPTACKADALAVEFGPGNPAPAAGDTGNIPVTLTNQDGTCVLQGAPATEVHKGERSWPVGPDTSAGEGRKLTLSKGEVGAFTITYVRGEAGDAKKGVQPDKVTFRLAGDGAEQTYQWPDAEIAVKSGDGLDITVGPFLPSGD
jgi:hypothetical protein